MTRGNKTSTRIERRKRKEEERKRKSTRLLAHVAEELREQAVSGGVHPGKQRGSRRSVFHMKMRFNLFDSADQKGEWSWGQKRDWCQEYGGCEGCAVHRSDLPPSDEPCRVSSSMQQMEQLTWSEIFSETTGSKNEARKKHHPQKLTNICSEAQNRWHELGRRESKIFRFRVSAKGRIWGHRKNEVFYVVWWDPDRKIYPTEKRS